MSPTSFGQALSAFLGDESDGGGASSSLPSSAIPSSSSKPASSSAAAQSQTHIQAQTQAPIFSLAPSISSRISSTKLSEKAARVALEERRSREDQFRVRDLIGGWGRPGEKPGQGPAAGAGAAVQGFGEDSDAEEGGEMDEWLREGGSKGFERRLRKVAQRGGEFPLPASLSTTSLIRISFPHPPAHSRQAVQRHPSSPVHHDGRCRGEEQGAKRRLCPCSGNGCRRQAREQECARWKEQRM